MEKVLVENIVVFCFVVFERLGLVMALLFCWMMLVMIMRMIIDDDETVFKKQSSWAYRLTVKAAFLLCGDDVFDFLNDVIRGLVCVCDCEC